LTNCSRPDNPMQELTPIIEIRQLSKHFNGKTALDQIDLSIRKGEFVTILGPSGCGKTTLLRIIAGFEVPSSGDVWMEGSTLTDTPPHLRPVNTVFQRYALFPHLNVFENIAFGLKIKKVAKISLDKKGCEHTRLTGLSPREIEKKVKSALKMVGMTGYEFRDVDSLSGGQQQRVAIARAIVNEPEVLLLDEPLGALDLKMRKDMQLELKEMHRKLGITFVYVTHDQEEALALSDTVVVMRDGRIQQTGSPIDIYNEPANAFVADFMGESNILDGTMVRDHLVRFADTEFECVDAGFGENTPVEVVIRPEDIYIFDNNEKGMLTGLVVSSLFKGIFNEMTVRVDSFEFVVQDTRNYEPGREVGLIIRPADIHVMEVERTQNRFEGSLIDAEHVAFLDGVFECTLPSELSSLEDIKGTPVQVDIRFHRVILHDNEEDGIIAGEIAFILYKCDHFHLTVHTDSGEDIYVNTQDVWDVGDRVGISVKPRYIKLSVP